jgi:hypothetical protein
MRRPYPKAASNGLVVAENAKDKLELREIRETANGDDFIAYYNAAENTTWKSMPDEEKSTRQKRALFEWISEKLRTQDAEDQNSQAREEAASSLFRVSGSIRLEDIIDKSFCEEITKLAEIKSFMQLEATSVVIESCTKTISDIQTFFAVKSSGPKMLARPLTYSPVGTYIIENCAKKGLHLKS